MAPKQTEIPGMERPKIAEIEDAAEAYLKTREKWQQLGEQLIEHRTALLNVMHTHVKKLSVNGDGERVYSFDEHIVVLKERGDTVKVKKSKEPEEDEDDE